MTGTQKHHKRVIGMKRFCLALLTALLLCSALPACAWEQQTVIAQDQLPAGLLYVLEDQAYVTCVAHAPRLFLLTEDGAGYRHINVFLQQPSGAYQLEGASAALPAVDAIKPTVLAMGGRMVIAYGEGLLYTFQYSSFKGWMLSTVQGERSYRVLPHLLVNESTDPTMLYAGNTSGAALYLFQPDTYSPNFALAAQNITWPGYALVSNPDPADRLHLRAEPDTEAASLGKYYNGTPVQMTEDLGDWAKVVVADVEGYMLKRYLAFDVHMLVTEPAFPHLNIREEYFGRDLTVYSQPDTESRYTGILTDYGSSIETIVILGVVGDDWYHVMTGGGLTGYMQAELFSPGNG